MVSFVDELSVYDFYLFVVITVFVYLKCMYICLMTLCQFENGGTTKFLMSPTFVQCSMIAAPCLNSALNI